MSDSDFTGQVERVMSATGAEARLAWQNWMANVETLSLSMKTAVGAVIRVNNAMVGQDILLPDGVARESIAGLQGWLHGSIGVVGYSAVLHISSVLDTIPAAVPQALINNHALIMAVSVVSNGLESQARQWVRGNVAGDVWKTLKFRCLLSSSIINDAQGSAAILRMLETEVSREHDPVVVKGAGR